MGDWSRRLWLAGAHCDFDLAQLIKEDVGGLEVVVDDAAGGVIQVGQPIKDLAGNCLDFLLRQNLHQHPLQPGKQKVEGRGLGGWGGGEGMWGLDRGWRGGTNRGFEGTKGGEEEGAKWKGRRVQRARCSTAEGNRERGLRGGSGACAKPAGNACVGEEERRAWGAGPRGGGGRDGLQGTPGGAASAGLGHCLHKTPAQLQRCSCLAQRCPSGPPPLGACMQRAGHNITSCPVSGFIRRRRMTDQDAGKSRQREAREGPGGRGGGGRGTKHRQVCVGKGARLFGLTALKLISRSWVGRTRRPT